MKRIGVLTSGGDAQGMNAAIYAVVRYALQSGLEVYGIEQGYKGLIERKIFKMDARSVDDIIHRGGTMLKTSRCPEMMTEEGQQKAHKALEEFAIDGLVVIGGDGSFRGAKVLSEKFGVQVIGIPGTIDNDLAYTDFTLGFDSAVNTVMSTIKMLRDTMSCNERTCVVEVMGRHCGDIALFAGITSGAELILVPEVPYTFEHVVDRLRTNMSHGKMDNIVVVAEGCGHAPEMVAKLRESIPGIDVRSMIVGHLQRGGDASFQDRLMGVRMGKYAVKCLLEGQTQRVIGIRDSKIIDEDIITALDRRKEFDMGLYILATRFVECF